MPFSAPRSSEVARAVRRGAAAQRRCRRHTASRGELDPANVILLQYLCAQSRLKRTVTMLKSRASAHDPEIREFDITPAGIVLGDPIGGAEAG